MREATKGRAGLPVKDWVLKTFPLSEGVGEVMEEGGKGRCSVVFLLRLSSMNVEVFNLFSKSYKLFVGCR